ncbi:hypothetical protein ATL41_0479 [Flavimobilis soli]|uniref:Uncharacterized protein n=1 Tax=Flavimobilis soli TaxID=442709 RepID=A0A2A9EBZ9_9MICO|nr:hypothetical protein [Flavimobilis soli]PFG35782.1 hypothetical protein ATL41_0479 [Flavimobilis soli]
MTGTSSVELPRSVRLALWLTAASRRGGPGAPSDHAERVVAAVGGDDEPHDLHEPGVEVPETGPAAFLGSDGSAFRQQVERWIAGGCAAVALVPPPGDASGLPAMVPDRAVEAGECVLLTCGTRHAVAVPEIVEFGSVWERGHCVTWHVTETGPWAPRFFEAVGTLADAENAMRHAVIQATGALVDLDVAQWREEAAREIDHLRSGLVPAWDLPEDVPHRNVQVLTTAARLRAIVALAAQDDGGATNLWQSDQRSTALREVERAARRALSAATFLPADDVDVTHL